MGNTVLENLKCGNMILLNAEVKDVKNACFFIKESTSNLKKIGETPKVEARSMIFEAANDKLLLLLLFRFNGDDNHVYGQWCTYYNSSQRKSLEILANDEMLTFSTLNIYNESIATFRCANPLREVIAQCAEDTKGDKWNIEEFKKNAISANKYFGGPALMFKASEKFKRFRSSSKK